MRCCASLSPARRQAWARAYINTLIERDIQDIVKPFVTGIVLYDGQQALSFGDGFWAVPLNQL